MDLVEHQSKIEQLAEDIITDQQLKIDYDRKLQENREALCRLREQQQKIKSSSRIATSTVNMGDFFVVVSTAKAQEMVDGAQKELEGAIEGVQQRLKKKVELLGKLESSREHGRDS
ncbi:hypothetical protein IWW36_003321 [Coemansia brasiliensis]|uniref:Uncharacterized protein n=1 Tax=Coemansia brasiliensis TaxID=2650707 RepID=A0A9W8I5K7_9FUNG|nr:hypothetical protein IWW36_003321 [Coemansia brasiliensis]